MSGNKIVKTPIVYYGGKTSIIQHILPLIPEHSAYNEAFFGGGTVLFAKDPAKNETNDQRPVGYRDQFLSRIENEF